MTIGQQAQAVNLDSGFSNVQEDLASERSEYTKMTTYHIKIRKPMHIFGTGRILSAFIIWRTTQRIHGI